MAKNLTIYMLLAMLAVLGTGCSGKKIQGKNLIPATSEVPRDDEDTTDDDHTGGATTEFVFKSTSALQKYTGRGISLDDIDNVTVNFDFENVEESAATPKYNGEVRIAYTQTVLDPVSGAVTGTSNKQATFWSSDSDLIENQVFDA